MKATIEILQEQIRFAEKEMNNTKDDRIINYYQGRISGLQTALNQLL